MATVGATPMEGKAVSFPTGSLLDVTSGSGALVWTPDSARVIYRADGDTDEVYELCCVEAASTGARRSS